MVTTPSDRNLRGRGVVYESDMADLGWFSETKSGSSSRVTRNKALATLTPMVTHEDRSTPPLARNRRSVSG